MPNTSARDIYFNGELPEDRLVIRNSVLCSQRADEVGFTIIYFPYCTNIHRILFFQLLQWGAELPVLRDMKIVGTTVTQTLQRTEQQVDLQLKYEVDNKRGTNLEKESFTSIAVSQKISSSNDLYSSQIDRSTDRAPLRSVQSAASLHSSVNSSSKNTADNTGTRRSVDKSTVLSLKRPRDSEHDRANALTANSDVTRSIPNIVLKKKSLTLSLTKPKAL